MSDAKIPRRRALTVLASASAAVAAAIAPAPARAEEPKSPRRRWGMAIDLDRCTGCGSCVVACQQENNVPTPATSYGDKGAQSEWMSMLWQEPHEPRGLPRLLPFPCQHCIEAPCVKVCPVGATFKDPEGITVQVWERCIGCRYCMVACPYERRSFNWEEPNFDGDQIQALNPDVATRPRGVVEKCTLCQHRIQDVKERAAIEKRAPTDGELQRLTACAASCPTEAITFGDLADPESLVSELASSPRVFRLLEDLGTEPSVFYLERDRRRG